MTSNNTISKDKIFKANTDSICRKTMMQNSLRQYKQLIVEYKLVKEKKHDKFKTAKEFYEYYDLKITVRKSVTISV